MKLRGVSICLLSLILLSMFGCSKDESIEKDYDKVKTEVENIDREQQSEEDNSVEDLEKKLSEFSYSSEENPKYRTMGESLEYVKDILPSGIEETNRVFESEVGVTSVTYEVDGLKFEVRYMHPHKEEDNMIIVDEYDLDKTAGISFKLK